MKKAIIVGATSGIGRALAKQLVNRNYTVGITGRRKAKLENLKQEAPDNYCVSPFDCVSTNNAVKLSALADELSGVDLFILCSGTGDLNETLVFDIENTTNQLNVIAFTEMVDWAFNYFQKQGHGQLVAISSIAGLRGSKIAPAYNASKAYQINYLEGLRQKAHHLEQEIYVTDIRPGFVDTAMAKGEGLFWVTPVQKAAKQIIRRIEQKKAVAYVSKRWRLVATLLSILPNWLYNFL